MKLRLSFIGLTLFVALVTVFVAAIEPTGPNAVSFNKPLHLVSTLFMIIVLFIPLFVLAMFGNIIVKIISLIYQSFIILAFLSLLLAAIILPINTFLVIPTLAGVVVTITSSLVTILSKET